ncbi:MAG: putative membrane protein [Clostridium sp.]|jgi:uncharacterized membrane protein
MNKFKFDFIRGFVFLMSLVILITTFVIPITNKSDVIITVIILILLEFVDYYIPQLTRTPEDSPRIKTLRFVNRFTMFVILIPLVFSILHIESAFSTSTNEKILVGFVSIIMMVLGNKFPQVKMNRYFGLRLPWTIRDEETWRVTHKLMGNLAFPLAILQLILVFFLPAEVAVGIGVLSWVIIGSLYSLYFYMKKYKPFLK